MTRALIQGPRLCSGREGTLVAKSSVSLQALEQEQRWVLFAPIQVLALLQPVPALQRAVAIFSTAPRFELAGCRGRRWPVCGPRSVSFSEAHPASATAGLPISCRCWSLTWPMSSTAFLRCTAEEEQFRWDESQPSGRRIIQRQIPTAALSRN